MLKSLDLDKKILEAENNNDTKLLKELYRKKDLLIEIDIDKDYYHKRLSDDAVINITGESGSGKSTLCEEFNNNSNFIVIDTDNYSKELRVIDLDSCKIGANDPSPARFLTPLSLLNVSNKYKVNNDENCLGHIIADRNSDLYCYCMIILNYLFGKTINKLSIDEFYRCINHLDTIGIDKELVDILYKIVNNCDNDNPMNYLDSITEKQIIKTRIF